MIISTKPSHDTADSERGTLMNDLKTVASSADAPMTDPASTVADELASVRCRMEAGISGAKSRVKKTRELMAERARGAAEATCSYANENPWKVAGIAVFTGLVVGIALCQRKLK